MLFPSGLMRSLYFNPRGPCGPRLHRRRNPPGRDISILAVLADRDDNPALRRTINQLFQSSRSLRTATLPLYAIDNNGNISILAVLADRDQDIQQEATNSSEISILAVLADRDGRGGLNRADQQIISILAVLADRDNILISEV